MDEKKNKVKVNIIYAPQGVDATSPRFTNDKGELWMHGSHKQDMYNISMSFYSANYPKPIQKGDSIYVIEPRCVTERDYEVNFLKRFRYVFTWATKAFEGTKIEHKVIPLHHSSCFGVSESVYEDRKKMWKSWDFRKKQIVFIANNKTANHESELYSLRIKMADWLYYNYKKYEVVWYGQSPLNKPYYKGAIEDKFNILRNACFSVCVENSYHPIYSYNYFTEKLPEVWFGGAVPLYMGCYNIDDFDFNPNSYIDLRKFYSKNNNKNDLDFPALIRELETFDAMKYQNVIDGIEYNIKQKNLFNLISEEKIMEKMIDVFYNNQ